MGLFATMPVDEVTVQDIATSVDMTPAAVYYHFASKEQILVEGMRQFSEQFVDLVRDHDAETIRGLFEAIIDWTQQQRTPATVFFVSSTGLNLMVEALRRETRLELVDVLRERVRDASRASSTAEAGVLAVGLVSLLETSLASMLNQDAAFRSLGIRRFTDEVGAFAERVLGQPVG